MLDDGAPAIATRRESGGEAQRAVRCNRCGHALTSEKERIEVDGAHGHSFVNPSGILFHVACFRAVDGAILTGEPDKHTSWFPGTAWVYALCDGCRGHVGWAYVRVDEPGAGERFFALIEDCITRG